MKMSLIIIAILSLALIVSCKASVGNGGSNNQDNDTYDIRLDYDADGDNDSDDKLAQCDSCVADLPEASECSCLDYYQCSESDLSPEYANALFECEPIVLGEEVEPIDSGLGEGAL
jgi:hypothetical protein